MSQKPSQSLVVSTADVAVMSCLGALHLWATRGFFGEPDKRGREQRKWGRDGYELVLFFPTRETEDAFIAKAQELLPAGTWSWSNMPD